MHQYFGIWSDIGFGLFGLSALVLAGGSVLGRLKRISNQDHERDGGSISARLERIEHIVEASALQIERLAESHRYSMKLLAERGIGQPVDQAPLRHVTPH